MFVPYLDEDAFFDRPLNDVAIALATRLPRDDEHSSVEVWRPVLNSKSLKAAPDLDADPCDDVVPAAACVPAMRCAVFFS
jgi:hypothetical protein